MTGSFNWDYTVQDNRIKKLYELGKQLNWNVEVDVDWTVPQELVTKSLNLRIPDNHTTFKTFDKETRLEFLKDLNSWATSPIFTRRARSIIGSI